MPFQGTHFFGATPFYNGVVNQSVRFIYGSDPNLNITHSSSSPTNNSIGTLSFWYKRGILDGGTGNNQYFIHTGTGSSNDTHMDFRINTDNSLHIGRYGDTPMVVGRVLRDPSAWYHFLVVFDSTSATASERLMKLYINGTESTYTSRGAIGQNDQFPWINASQAIYIGRHASVNRPMDAYIAEWNIIDGQALLPTSFGEFKNGVWIPKQYTGTYGNHGVRLQFKNTSVGSGTASTIGADTSGSGNHWTSSGIAASDCNLPDCPENNFATWNPLFEGGERAGSIYADSTVTKGNLEVSVPQNSFMGSTFRPTSGKWYAEIRLKTLGSTNGEVDWGWIQATEFSDTTVHDGHANKWGVYYHAYSTDHLTLYDETSQLGSDINLTMSAGNIMQLAWDIDNRKAWVGLNNTYYAADSGTDGNPSAGTNETFSFTEDEAKNLQVYIGNGTGTDVHTVNFGQDSTFAGAVSAGGNADANGIGDFAYAPPTGFLACCSSNLAEPTIGPNSATQSDDHFKSVLYTGTGTSGNSVTVGFKTDWLWIKRRNGNTSHRLIDSSRGADRYLSSDTTNAEDDATGIFTSFDTNGFTVEGTGNATNGNTNTYVSWNWKANGGTTSSNSDGSITSTVQANTTAGFSIVTYTGNATAGATVGHGLGAVPNWYFVKRRSNTGHWEHYHSSNTSAPETEHLRFTDGATEDNNVYWNDTAPTSTVFSLGNQTNVNENANTYVAYVFTQIEGYSKFGGHEGNNSTNGQFIFTGFKPAWVMVKNIDAAGENWHIFDNARAPTNVIKARLIADGNTQENTNDNIIDFLANGFKWRDNNAGYNNSNTFIYFAFAEVPFKYANAR